MQIVKYRELDHLIFKTLRSVSILKYLRPTNLISQKNKFLSGKVDTPDFHYRKPTYDTQKVEEELNAAKTVSTPIGKIYSSSIEYLKLQNKLIQNVQNSKKVRTISKKLFGKPIKKTVRKAKQFLTNIEKKDKLKENSYKTITPKNALKRVKKALSDMKLLDWRANLTNNQSASISSRSKKLKLSKKTNYSINNIKRLIVHEIFGHAFRAENGFNQPYKIFGLQLPGYLSTEEGIASYLEEKYNLETKQSKKRFALRVLAVYFMDKGYSFKKTFSKLKEYESDKQQQWKTTLRTYRGGGFYKDHVYFEGYLKVKKFIKNGGNLDDLYIGKIAFDHLDLCKSLIKRGELNKPKHLPPVNY